VTWRADTFRRTGFWSVTPDAYRSAATRHSATPSGVDEEADASADVATPMITAPAKATAQPARSRRGKPSPRNRPANSAMKIGADGHEHRRGPSVDEAFRRVEDHVVAGEPGDARRHDEGEVATAGSHPRPRQGEHAQHEDTDDQSRQRDRARREVDRGGTDADERRRPQHDRHEGRRDSFRFR
jgi:hypothetical protein